MAQWAEDDGWEGADEIPAWLLTLVGLSLVHGVAVGVWLGLVIPAP